MLDSEGVQTLKEFIQEELTSVINLISDDTEVLFTENLESLSTLYSKSKEDIKMQDLRIEVGGHWEKQLKKAKESIRNMHYIEAVRLLIQLRDFLTIFDSEFFKTDATPEGVKTASEIKLLSQKYFKQCYETGEFALKNDKAMIAFQLFFSAQSILPLVRNRIDLPDGEIVKLRRKMAEALHKLQCTDTGSYVIDPQKASLFDLEMTVMLQTELTNILTTNTQQRVQANVN